MADISAESALALAAVLFCLGLVGLAVRRNVLFVLMSIEIMLNAGGVAFVAAGARWQEPDGQVMFFFMLTMSAAEVAVGLALVLAAYQRLGSLDSDTASRMRG